MMIEARNKNIVRLLEEKGNIIENRHTGIATMRDEMRKAGLPEPEFQCLRWDFKVIFRKELKEIDIEWTENGQKIKNKILLIITENPYITQKEIIEKLKISRTTVTNNIRILKDENKIKRIGSDRKGYWEIKK